MVLLLGLILIHTHEERQAVQREVQLAEKQYTFLAALYDGDTPVLPRDRFVFRRTPRRIFFIGFNKTATSSIMIMMMASGIRTLHSSGNGKIFGRSPAEKHLIPNAIFHIRDNIEKGVRPIEGLEDYDAFMDLTAGPVDLCLHFRAFYRAYPDALFILNTRPEDNWITSRMKHKHSVQKAAKFYDMTPRQVIRMWRKNYRQHHKRVRRFFGARAPTQFLEWDIGSGPAELAVFLDRFDIKIDPKYYFRLRETDEAYFPPPLRIERCTYAAPILPYVPI